MQRMTAGSKANHKACYMITAWGESRGCSDMMRVTCCLYSRLGCSPVGRILLERTSGTESTAAAVTAQWGASARCRALPPPPALPPGDVSA